MYDAGSTRWPATFLGPPGPTDDQDRFGRPQGGMLPQFSTRVGIRDLSGREILVADQVQADVRTLMWARWRDGVKASWQVKVTRNGTTWTYEIAEPPRDPDEGLRVWMEFFVRRLESPTGN